MSKKVGELNSNQMLVGNDRYYTVEERELGNPGAHVAACKRISKFVSKAEKTAPLRRTYERKFFEELVNFRLVPGGRFWANASLKNAQLANCFVIPIHDSKESIFKAVGKAAQILSGGGGVGYDFSRLRSKGQITSASRGIASGPVSFLKVFDAMAQTIVQGGCVSPDTRVLTEFGLKRVSDIVALYGEPTPGGWKDVRFNIDTHMGTREVTGIYNNGEVVGKTIKSRYGYTLSTSNQHMYKVFRGGEFIWVRADEITVGDYITLALDTDSELGRVVSLKTSQIRHYNTKPVVLPSVLDVSLAELLGLYYGDGFNLKGGIGFSLNDSERSLLEYLHASLWNNFAAVARVEKEPGDGESSRYIVNSVLIRRFLEQNSLLKQSKAKLLEVPEHIFESKLAIRGAFLRGLFEADGNITEDDYGNIYISLTTASEQLRDHAHQLLSSCGVVSRKSEQDISLARKRANGGYGESSGRYYSIHITTDVGRSQFLRRVGFLSINKQAILERYSDRARAAVDYIPGLQGVFSKPYDTSQDSAFKRRIARFCEPVKGRSVFKGRDVTRKGLVTLSSEYSGGDELQVAVEEIDRSLTFFDRVESIEEYRGMTFDFSVAGVEEYVANGVAVHNSRRGANMGVLRIDHPDILEFVFLKDRTQAFNRFNVSVGVTAEFTPCDDPHIVVDPHTKVSYALAFKKGMLAHTTIEELHATLKVNHDSRILVDIADIAESKDKYDFLTTNNLWDAIAYNAWGCGDPGLIFLDEINSKNPLLPDEDVHNVEHPWYIRATNPCGEIPQADNEICMLAAVNLSVIAPDLYLDKDFAIPETVADVVEHIDWDGLRQTVRLGVRFLDNGIDVSDYPDDISRKNAQTTRRIGLGLMGWADLLIKLKITYGSDLSILLAQNIGEFISSEALKVSIELGEEKGSFPLFEESMYCKNNASPSDRFVTVQHLRHSFRTTIAPVGSTGIYANSSHSAEPIFSLGYKRMDGLGERWVRYPLYDKYVEKYGDNNKPDYFIQAADITVEQHIRMQAAFQANIDNAISKTINLPQHATVLDFKQAYVLARELKCKGITAYRDKSKEIQVMNTDVEAGHGTGVEKLQKQIKRQHGPLPGQTYKVTTGGGSLLVSINSLPVNGSGGPSHPIEIIITTGKSGSDESAYAEALGRSISVGLQFGVPLESYIKQFIGISGKQHVFEQIGEHRKVLSVPDAVGKIFLDFTKNQPQVVVVEPELQAVSGNGGTGQFCDNCGEEIRTIENCAVCGCTSACEH